MQHSETTVYFGECAGEIVQLAFPEWIQFETHIRGRVGTCPRCNGKHPIAREVHHRANPARRGCHPRCIGAVGPSCDCPCGGRNHGAGYIPSGELFTENAPALF